MKRLNQVLASIVLVLTGAALLMVVLKGSDLILAPNPNVGTSDFIGIILTALGVMLTAVTVFLGALALIGWATFEARVNQSAEAFLEKRFSEKDPRYLSLVEDLRRASLEGTRQKYPDENNSPYSEDAA